MFLCVLGFLCFFECVFQCVYCFSVFINFQHFSKKRRSQLAVAISVILFDFLWLVALLVKQKQSPPCPDGGYESSHTVDAASFLSS